MGHVNFRAEDFNRLAQRAMEAALLTVKHEGDRDYPHPWKAIPFIKTEPIDPYDRNLMGRWRLRFVPGLVNMESPQVRMASADAPEAARERLRLRPNFVSNGTSVSRNPGAVDVFLDEGPEITPDFTFLDPPADVIPPALQFIGGGVTRQIAATDIVLRIPRPVSTTQVQIGFGDQSQTLQLNPVFRRASAQPFRLVSLPRWQPFSPTTRPLLDVLFNPFGVETFDDIRVCTFYLLSPKDLGGTQPNRLWQPFVRQYLHHNLIYYPPDFADSRVTRGINLIVSLAAGLAQPAINAFLGQQNLFTEAIRNLGVQQQRSGRFMSI